MYTSVYKEEAFFAFGNRSRNFLGYHMIMVAESKMPLPSNYSLRLNSSLFRYICLRVCRREPVCVDAPLQSFLAGIYINTVQPQGKPSQTLFERISYDGHTSVVKCECAHVLC